MSQVTTLRKAGQLQEALELGRSLLAQQPENIWCKRDLSWVYYDHLKLCASYDQRAAFMDWISEVKKLELGKDETMLFDSVAFQLAKLLFDTARQKFADTVIITQAIDLATELHHARPSEAHSALLHATIKLAPHYHRLTEYVLWWDLPRAMAKDFEKEEFKGKKLPSLVERTCIAVGKELLSQEITSAEEQEGNRERLNKFLDVIDRILAHHADLDYVVYYQSKLLQANGDAEKALTSLLPFARRKQQEFWVWQLLGQLKASSPDDQLACLCRAMQCKAPSEFLVKVRETLAEVLVHREQFAEARTEIDLLVRDREQQGWPIKEKVRQWTQAPWYQQAKGRQDNTALYELWGRRASDLLHGDVPFQLAVVEHVNRDKGLVFFGIAPGHSAHFHASLDKQVFATGDTVEVKMIKVTTAEKSFEKVLEFRRSDKPAPNSMVQSFEGILVTKTDKNGALIGFVRPGLGSGPPAFAQMDVFVPPDVLQQIPAASEAVKVSGRALVRPKPEKPGIRSRTPQFSLVAFQVKRM